MTKLICYQQCKYNDNDELICTREEVVMSWRSVKSKYDGMLALSKCEQYKMNDRLKEFRRTKLGKTIEEDLEGL